MQVYSNITSFAVWGNYRSNLTSMRRSMARLSSGLRIGMAGDDPSGLAMSERMRAQIRNTAAASSNVENKINYLQTADSWLQKIHDLLGRMGELAIMANDGTRSATDRENLEREFEQMQKEIQRITTGATAAGRFNGLYLFRGGTGVASTQNDLIVGTGTVGGATLTNLDHDGASVGSHNWMATYNDIQMEWTIRNATTGDVFTLAAAPDAGAEMVFDDATYGFRLVIHPPQLGTYGSGDTINWTTEAYVPPVMGSTRFQNISQTGNASFTPAGTGEDVSNSAWTATYDAGDELWTVRRNGVTMGTISAAPEDGGSAVFEGANGFQITINAPTTGSYATGSQLSWSNTGALLGSTGLSDASSATTAIAGSVVRGDGSSISSGSWLAQYDAVAQTWTIRRNGTLITTLSAAPDAGGVFDLEGANGFRFTINAPTVGQFTTNDQFTWTTVAHVDPVAGGASLTDASSATTGSGSNVVAGDGSGVTTANWSATYNAVSQLWTIQRNGVNYTTLAADPDAGGSVALEGANGTQFTVQAPTSGQYTTNDRFTWSNTAQVIAVLGSTGLNDSSSATTGTATNAVTGNGLGVTTANWSATYNAVSQLWTIQRSGVNYTTLAADPDAGGSVTLEGANGTQFTVQAPTSGEYTTGDRFTWANTAELLAGLGGVSMTDTGTPTTGSGSNSILGTGHGITTANWTATYNDTTQLWTVRRNGTIAGTISAAPDAGGQIDLEGVNGFRFTIDAPTSGTYNTGDILSWSNTGYAAPVAGSTTYTDANTATTATAANSVLGTGRGITSASWTATYDAVDQEWTVRRNGSIAGTFSTAPDAGGSIDLEGANGFRFAVNAPTGGEFDTGDQFTWTNSGYSSPVIGSLSYTDNSAATNGSAGNGLLGTGLGVTSASWTATYDAVNQEWTVRRAGVVMGTISAAPNGGGQIDLEGANGFRFTVNTPASGQYNTGDRFIWTNSAYQAPVLGSATMTDTNPSTSGTSGNAQLGLGTDITSANWTATYDAVAQQWMVRRNGVLTNTMASAPNAGGTVDLEGANGFRYTINAPTSGQYNTGDQFFWTTTRLLPPTLGTGLTLTPAGSPGDVAATVMVQDDGYDVTTARWRATYDAGGQWWEIRNMDTGVVGGYLNAGPEGGGTLMNIEGNYGFSLTIAAPSSSSYSTGDYFQWQNTAHVAADPGMGYYKDKTTINLSLQVGPDSNQVFEESAILLEADSYELIGSYATYSYGSVNMTLLGDTRTWVRWASLICPQQLRIEEQAKAQAAVDKINIGVDYLSSIRATIGAEMNRMTETLQALRNYEENMRTSESRIRDTDVALETTQYAKFNILNRINVAMLAQANTLPSGVLRMLGVG